MPHPIWALLDAEGRRLEWLARQAGYTPEYVSRVKNGRVPLTGPFRARCAEVLGRTDSELFDLSEPLAPDDSDFPDSAPRPLTNSDEILTRR